MSNEFAVVGDPDRLVCVMDCNDQDVGPGLFVCGNPTGGEHVVVYRLEITTGQVGDDGVLRVSLYDRDGDLIVCHSEPDTGQEWVALSEVRATFGRDDVPGRFGSTVSSGDLCLVPGGDRWWCKEPVVVGEVMDLQGRPDITNLTGVFTGESMRKRVDKASDRYFRTEHLLPVRGRALGPVWGSHPWGEDLDMVPGVMWPQLPESGDVVLCDLYDWLSLGVVVSASQDDPEELAQIAVMLVTVVKHPSCMVPSSFPKMDPGAMCHATTNGEKPFIVLSEIPSWADKVPGYVDTLKEDALVHARDRRQGVSQLWFTP